MGYIFGWNQIDDMQADIRSDFEFGNDAEIVADHLHRSTDTEMEWYVLVRDIAVNEFFVVVYLFEYDKTNGDWGYKTIPEHHGPFYYNVPLDFINANKYPPHPEYMNPRWRVLARNRDTVYSQF
jgi:hypothetical protein